MEAIADERAIEAARRCLAARARYRNAETRQSLERAAGKFALKALGLLAEQPEPLHVQGETTRQQPQRGLAAVWWWLVTRAHG